MPDIEHVVLDHIQNEPALSKDSIGVEVKAGGLFHRRKTLHLYGSVHSKAEKERVERIAEKEGGDNYDIVNDITVKE